MRGAIGIITTLALINIIPTIISTLTIMNVNADLAGGSGREEKDMQI